MELFEKALIFAAEKHAGQRRRSTTLPYIFHPIEVATIVSTMTDDQNVLAAAVLHDTVEDTDTTLEEIEANFGKRVALLVMTETEEKREDRPPAETWELRKEETLIILENTKDVAVKMMWLGDKLSNMRSFARSYRIMGDDLWQMFNQKDPKKQCWYYKRIIKCFGELKEYEAYREFESLVNYVFHDHLGGTENEV